MNNFRQYRAVILFRGESVCEYVCVCVCELQYDKPVAVAVSSNVFTSKKNNISIGSASGGTEIATVSRATPSLSETFIAVST